ncbi:MAG: phosphoenolpyruvate carboxylase [Candidatus Micrarchaeota archaeon]|nr:phosphoenolpyruvate carboxylase [Candidatus Micrarchaeota archaeon]
MTKLSVPRCMSTQHPDNVNSPFFSDSEVLAGETEIKETYYVYSHLGITEQMWDCEGKEVDSRVVEKLLSRYPKFFSENTLGEKVFLTLRVPNPNVEKTQGKILLETLESIPLSYDIAKAAGGSAAPIWEVILPMCTSGDELDRIYDYYNKVVVGKKDTKVGKVTVSEWVGKFAPEEIRPIPLVEDRASLSSADKIVGDFLKGKRFEHQRVFLARSDPALNYGSLSAVLLNKLCLQRLHNFQEKSSVEILPIIGVGSAPFRGNLKPSNPQNCLREYPSVQTFTLQSSFKYDYSESTVRSGVETINESVRSRALAVDEELANRLVDKATAQYQKEVAALSGLITTLSRYNPSRRARKLHIGLFGYSRSLKGISLPRAIPFCSALYSIGVPPELLGLSALSEKELDSVRTMYLSFDEDISDALRYASRKSMERLPGGIGKQLLATLSRFKYEPDSEYCEAAEEALDIALSDNRTRLTDAIMRTAWKRNFIG